MRWKTVLWLIGVNLYISAFTFGGGYVVIPMIRKFYVRGRNLLTEDDVMDMAAIAQSSPGAIAVNLAVLAGYRVAGMRGAIASCLASVAPPIAVLSVVSMFYAAFRDNAAVAAVLLGMQAGVAALIADMVIDMFAAITKERRLLSTLIAPAAFVANVVLGVNVGIILVASAALAATECVWTATERSK